MPSVAILYYSQTGQSQRIAESLTRAYAFEGLETKLIPIQSKVPYSFPWKMNRFFEQMPYCMEGISPEIEAIDPLLFQNVDKIVLVHPVWFLSPSLPVQAFFKLPSIEYILKGKKLVQILSCRNMWFMAAKKTRDLIVNAGGIYSGEIVLEDSSPNWASLITTPRWMFSGKKNAFAFFPAAGIAEKSFLNFDKKAYFDVEKLFNSQAPSCCENKQVSRSKALSICLEIFGHNVLFVPWAKIILKTPKTPTWNFPFIFSS